MKITIFICALFGIWILSLAEEPKIRLVFSGWFSFAFILALVFGIIAWITYVARSISYIKKKLPHMATKDEVKTMFEEFKNEISGKEQTK